MAHIPDFLQETRTLALDAQIQKLQKMLERLRKLTASVAQSNSASAAFSAWAASADARISASAPSADAQLGKRTHADAAETDFSYDAARQNGTHSCALSADAQISASAIILASAPSADAQLGKRIRADAAEKYFSYDAVCKMGPTRVLFRQMHRFRHRQ